VYAYTNLIVFIAQLIGELLTIYLWIVIISALLTWVNPDPYNPIVRFLYGVTEPVFDWVREHLPVFLGGIDFSPMVVIIFIWFVQGYVLPVTVHTLLYGFS
jgi:YggT family protein